MNIFSGARRIAFIVAALIVVLGTGHVFTSKPNVTLYYSIPFYEAPVVAAIGCDFSESAYKRMSFKTKNGDEFDVVLCFMSSEAEDGRNLVPYTRDDGQVFMNEPRSADVEKYVERYARNLFALSEKEIAEAEAAYSSAYWEEKGRAIGGVAAGLFGFWLSVLAIGWVARGFLGIPRGQDHRIAPVITQK